MESFYDNEGNVKKELFDKTAEAIARSFIKKDNRGNEYGVSSTQLRRFFDEVKRFEQLLDGTPETWKNKFPYIKMIKSKVRYNVARAKANKEQPEKDAYESLSSFIIGCLDDKIVKEEKDFRVFVALFEAVYGYYYDIEPERKKKERN